MKIVNKSCIYSRAASGVVLVQDGKVLLLSSLKGPYIVLPKGGVEYGLTPAANALKELQEEAGLRCEVNCTPVFDEVIEYEPSGDYPGKVQREIYFLGYGIVSDVAWEEEDLRTRYWLTLEEMEGVVHPVQIEIIKKALEVA